MKEKKVIVISGINLYTGGTLKIMQDFLHAFSSYASDNYKLIALVHKVELYSPYNNVEYIAFPKSRKSWFFRLYYEYFGFRKFSRKLNPYCWISMHDLTPNIKACRRFVYCHSAFPFYRPKWRDLWLQYPVYMFSLFFKYTYRINIKKNNHVIVQQEWMRQAFKKLYSIDNIVVSLPVTTSQQIINAHRHVERNLQTSRMFFYPTGATVHKNLDVLCKAVSLLEKSGITNFKVILTIDGKENRYTQYIYDKYNYLKNLEFAGFLSRTEMDRYYHACNCVIFPSKLETWGLPLTEAKQWKKPILVSELPYARETVGNYSWARFFDPNNAIQLSDLMSDFLKGTITYDQTKEMLYNEPVKRSWEELFEFITEKE